MSCSVFAKEVRCKTPDADIDYDFEFTDLLASGDTLASTPSMTEQTTSDLTIGNRTAVAISGTKVQGNIKGGTAGTTYTILGSVVTTNGETLEIVGELIVKKTTK